MLNPSLLCVLGEKCLVTNVLVPDLQTYFSIHDLLGLPHFKFLNELSLPEPYASFTSCYKPDACF